MHRKLFLGILVALALLSPAAAQAGGDIYVGGPYGTKITSLPYTITTPGSYYLGGNLSYPGDSSSTAIFINADNVTLDLMGFTLSGIPGTVNFGIWMLGRNNVEIRNGTMSGWYQCIFESSSGLAHRIFNLRFEGVRTGVYLFGSGHLVQGCQATGCGGIGDTAFMIEQGIVRDCMAKNFLGIGIWTASMIRGSIISGNVISTASASEGIATQAPSLIIDNAVADCATGIRANGGSLIGNTVNTTGSSQTGISAITSDIYPTLMDQNTVTGPGTHYNWGSGAVAWRNNAGYP